ERLRTAGLPPEDVPSPSFTLVQVYDAAGTEIWHADLFRLGNVAEADELGLSDAYDTAICLIEWPERLGPEAPADALRLAFAYDGEARIVTLSASAPRWRPILADLRREYATLRAQGAT
ncbi:tRNA (adenosine(37)-N6)-threonylcarbamoyltransferase complex ATPase subunit type 1 TsaE, partial [Phaeovulum sp.]|uniref:tRNA (adenosine(37)-N6)-threonylcarbamoyltransferase complex ATPase subunit type 1 TsaE n=1 Tax=Phaeovulum sp. TaxID=2934796 RepID=UPI00356A73B6